MPKFEIDESEGVLELNVKSADGTPSVVKLDIWRAYNSYAALSTQHAEMVARGDAWVEWLTAAGVPPVNHGAAFRIADAIIREVELTGKARTFLADCRLAKFYGFPVWDLSSAEKLILAGAMPILKAEAELEGPVADARLYDVILAATGSEEQATDAMTARIAYRLRRDEKFEG